MEEPKSAHEAYRHAAKLLSALTQGTASPGQVLGELLADLETRCQSCSTALADYPRERLVARAGGSYDEAMAEASRAAVLRAADLARERDEAGELIEELLSEPVLSRALALARASPRFHTWGLVSQLVDLAEKSLLEEPEEARHWAEVAVQLAYSLDKRRYLEGVVEDLRAVARSMAARSCLASGGSVGQAERELGRAGHHAAAGTGIDGVRLELALAYAEVLLAQARWKEAAEVLSGVRDRDDLGAGPGEVVRAGRLLAEAFRQAGQLKMAVSALRGSLVASAAAGDRDGPGRFAGLDLVEILCEAEWFDDAAAELREQERRFAEEGPAWADARKEWVRAWIDEGSGRIAEAQRGYAAARLRLSDAGLAVLAARAAVRELRILLAQSEEAEALRLVSDLTELYEHPGLPRWSRAFLFRFQVEAWGDGVGLATAEAVEEALARPPGVYEGSNLEPAGPPN